METPNKMETPQDWRTPQEWRPPNIGEPPRHSMLGDMVNPRAVRILLECNLVSMIFLMVILNSLPCDCLVIAKKTCVISVGVTGHHPRSARHVSPSRQGTCLHHWGYSRRSAC